MAVPQGVNSESFYTINIKAFLIFTLLLFNVCI